LMQGQRRRVERGKGRPERESRSSGSGSRMGPEPCRVGRCQRSSLNSPSSGQASDSATGGLAGARSSSAAESAGGTWLGPPPTAGLAARRPRPRRETASRRRRGRGGSPATPGSLRTEPSTESPLEAGGGGPAAPILSRRGESASCQGSRQSSPSSSSQSKRLPIQRPRPSIPAPRPPGRLAPGGGACLDPGLAPETPSTN
jgi:hypothetical protein